MDNPFPYEYGQWDWLDAETVTGWENAKNILPSDELVCTRGWLIKKTKTSYIVGASICHSKVDQDYQFNTRIQIPKSMVKKYTMLSPKSVKAADADPANPG
jgi:hypothetical protein